MALAAGAATVSHASPNPTSATHAAGVAPSCKKGYYKNVDGVCVHGPTQSPSVPAGATAKCRDGSYSFSLHASGTCSHHGGVAVWIHHP
jgi:hypothetical protein